VASTTVMAFATDITAVWSVCLSLC